MSVWQTTGEVFVDSETVYKTDLNRVPDVLESLLSVRPWPI